MAVNCDPDSDGDTDDAKDDDDDRDDDVSARCNQVVPLLAFPTMKTGDFFIFVERHPGKRTSSRKKPMWLYIMITGTTTAKRHKMTNLLAAKSSNMGEIASSCKLSSKRLKKRYKEKRREFTITLADSHSTSIGMIRCRGYEMKNGRGGQMSRFILQ